MDRRDDDSNFRERFDMLATYIELAILGLASATWIGLTIRRLYY
jgi:hypothetical protein